MSISYWSIKGIGLMVEELKWDYDKVLEAYDTNWVEEAVSEGYFDFEEYKKALEDDSKISEIAYNDFISSFGDEKLEILLSEDIEALFSDESLISYLPDGNDGSYLLVEARLPWEFSEQERKMSEKEIIEAFAEELKPFVRNSKEEIVSMVRDINTSGQG